uniref:Uncharacterized protein n=1 Tax=Manihot esculenta TaxID=3983 RepID=A0A2C9VCN8_MANES
MPTPKLPFTSQLRTDFSLNKGSKTLLTSVQVWPWQRVNGLSQGIILLYSWNFVNTV